MGFEWSVEKGDFFPYNGYKLNHYWSGYFTSRPNFKKQIRDFSGVVQASDTFYSLDLLSKKDTVLASMELSERYTGAFFNSINRRIGTNIHHDTITGTSPIKIIREAAQDIEKVMETNALQLSKTMRIKTYEGDQIKLDKLLTCFTHIDQRDICTYAFQYFSKEDNYSPLIWVVYNP